MVSKTNRALRVVAGVAIMLGTLAAVPALAAGNPHDDGIEEAVEQSSPMSKGLIMLGAALELGIPAIATGMAQARIGAAGIGAIAENPKRLGAVIMLIAIPETVAILGFVIAYLILSQ